MTDETDDTEQFECATCETDTPVDTGETLSNGDQLCDDCAPRYFACSHCEQTSRNDDAQRTEDDEEVCERCADRYYTYSSVQQRHIPNDRTVTLEDSGEVVSITWAERNAYQGSDDEWYEDEENRPNRALHDYCENVLEHCRYDKQALVSGALVFGVELEIEPVRGSSQGQLVEALGGRTGEQFILKEDGSLVDGVEIVTVPLTLENHLMRFNWQELLPSVLSIGMSGAGTENCGMHVHINKAALSPLQIGKMLVFLNSPAMRSRITTIAQRESNTYCERGEKKLTDGRGHSENRYDIVNVSLRTVEIRMFRGTLRADRVFKNLEFCHALVRYCRDASLKAVEEWSEFASWLLKRRSQYPNLIRFLAEKHEVGFLGAVRSRNAKAQELATCA
jgi:hypothetical protein